MRIALSLAAAAALWATPAMATDWFLVGVAADNSTASFVDKDSIATVGEDLRRAQSYQLFATDAAGGVAGYQSFLEYDCASPRYRFLNVKTINAAGVTTVDDVGSGKWRPIDPGSLDEGQQIFVCSGGAKPDDAVSYGNGPLIARGRSRLRGGVFGGH